jgi:hypothetical protein
MSKPYIDIGPCSACGCRVLLPEALEEAARHSSHVHFYCPYGHVLHFPKTEKKVDPSPITSKIFQLVKKD